MPRRPVPVTETKAEKFQRLANLRTNLIIDGLRKLGSLSNNNRYDYSEDEVQRIVSTIEEAVADAKSRFLGQTRREFRLYAMPKDGCHSDNGGRPPPITSERLGGGVEVARPEARCDQYPTWAAWQLARGSSARFLKHR
jgi:hypothetical protein